MSNIDKSVLVEILRKLTPAIGRVLAKRRKGDEHNSCSSDSPEMCEGCLNYGYNSALEQVLDPDIVEAVVRDSVRDEGVNVNGYKPYHYTGNGCILGITSDFLNHLGEIKKSHLPALVAEAWAK